MEKSSLLKKLFTKKTKDYGYAIAFFFIFSFFIYFVIRPNLLSVFEANRKIEELKKTNALYEEQIDKIIDTQTILESNREGFILLGEAIAKKPEVNKVLSDINVSSDEGKLLANRVEVSDINLKETGTLKKIKSFIVNMNLKGTFEETLLFVKKMYEQRRLKLIPDLQFSREESESSQSSTLNIKLQVEGYYL
ncbi:type 4a pilus biogenesis protein PilO [Candidatus Roizmanbacteria bacterium]|nr:type 4a pilus biogenesis protein PilO [Candidatus Roizmanbacteria bacterium]